MAAKDKPPSADAGAQAQASTQPAPSSGGPNWMLLIGVWITVLFLRDFFAAPQPNVPNVAAPKPAGAAVPGVPPAGLDVRTPPPPAARKPALDSEFDEFEDVAFGMADSAEARAPRDSADGPALSVGGLPPAGLSDGPRVVVQFCTS